MNKNELDKMEKEKLFEEFYEKLVNEEADSLNKKKKNAGIENIRNRVLSIILIIIVFITIFYLIKMLINPYLIVLIIILYSLVIYAIKTRLISHDKRIDFTSDFKEKVIKGMTSLLDKDALYNKYNSISEDMYNEAEFENYDRLSSDFTVSGKLKNNSNYIFGDVKTDFFERRKRMRGYRIMFFGLFVSIEHNKELKDAIYIKNGDNILFRNIGYYKVPSKKLKVKFDSPEFEKEFDVYSADNNLVSKIITPDIMKSLLDFKKEMNIRYEITIKDNHIYYRFFCGKLYKNNPLNSNPIDKKSLYKYYKVIEFSLNISEKLTELVKKTEY